MSLRQHLLNRCLRLTEKPLLARANPQMLRATMEMQARLFFKGPRKPSNAAGHDGDAGAALF